MKIKLKRFQRAGTQQLYYKYGLAYLLKRSFINSCSPTYYQLGISYRSSNWFIQFKNKPRFRNLFIINSALFVPFILWQLFVLTVILPVVMTLTYLFYAIFGHWKRTYYDKNALIPVSFWMITSTVLAYFLLFGQ